MTATTIANDTDRKHRSLVSVFLDAYLAIQERRRQRSAMEHVHDLNDHALRDIGLQRIDVSPVVSAAPLKRRHRHVRH